MKPPRAMGRAAFGLVRSSAASCVTVPACAVSRLFLIGSVGAVGLVIAYLLTGGGEAISIMAVQTASARLEAVGLTYAGVGGLMMATGQVGAVLVAWWASAKARGRVRGIALGVLVAWAGLWLANAMWLASQTDIAWRHVATVILGATFVATVIRAIKDWPREPREKRPGPSWTLDDRQDGVVERVGRAESRRSARCWLGRPT